MTPKLRFRIAGSLGFLVGALSIFAGSSVLLGAERPDYHVLRWLVVYNLMAGVISALLGAAIIGQRPWAARAAGALAAAHLGVLLILVGLRASSASPVADQSLGAMTFRSTVWLLITLLVWKLGRAAPGARAGDGHLA